MYKFLFRVLFVFLLVGQVFATALSPRHYPADLIFLNHPVDPLCFFELEDSSGLIHLKKCGALQSKLTITGQNAELTKKNYFGFDWKNVSVDYASGGYSYYQAWDAGNHQYWIYTANNGGGSGDFTALNLYSRKDFETANITTVESGDRCNGGVQDVREQKSGLQYSVNLTAFDLFALAEKNPHNIKPYDDLSACAACCVAKAYYYVDKSLKPTLEYVLADRSLKLDELPDQGALQNCFNKLLVDYVKQHRGKLAIAQVYSLMHKFNEKCHQ